MEAGKEMDLLLGGFESARSFRPFFLFFLSLFLPAMASNLLAISTLQNRTPSTNN